MKKKLNIINLSEVNESAKTIILSSDDCMLVSQEIIFYKEGKTIASGSAFYDGENGFFIENLFTKEGQVWDEFENDVDEVVEEVVLNDFVEEYSTTERTEIYFHLGNFGHKAEKLKQLFSEYYTKEDGKDSFLSIENTTYIGNKGVMVHTNCFDSEEQFKELLMTRLLFNL